MDILTNIVGFEEWRNMVYSLSDPDSAQFQKEISSLLETRLLQLEFSKQDFVSESFYNKKLLHTQEFEVKNPQVLSASEKAEINRVTLRESEFQRCWPREALMKIGYNI
jgi:hypothetical protein